jgi:PhnB protein
MATTNAADKNQRLFPYLGYRDCPEAIRFLCEAFGFQEHTRMAMPDGRIGHAELALQDNRIMLATAWEEAGMRSPLDLDGIHTMLMCIVDDVDAHYRKAREAGATIIGEPETQPYGRSYRAVDPEGHRWIFLTENREDTK